MEKRIRERGRSGRTRNVHDGRDGERGKERGSREQSEEEQRSEVR